MLKIVQITAAFVFIAVLSARAEKQNLLESGSFEWPPVRKKKAISEGADVSKSAMNAEWFTFKDSATGEGGKLVMGLTNEIFRTGRQCVFVEFEKLTRPLAVAQLASDFVSIKPGEMYRIGVWGRIDKEQPIALDQRVPHLKLRVDWFLADREEQTGEVEYRVQPIPGSANRPPMFVAGKWSEYFANLKAPAEAAFVRVTWTFESGPNEGETNGIIYFDDAGIEGEPGPKEAIFEDEPEMEDDDEKPSTPAEKPAIVAPALPLPKVPQIENLALPLSGLNPAPAQAESPRRKPKAK